MASDLYRRNDVIGGARERKRRERERGGGPRRRNRFDLRVDGMQSRPKRRSPRSLRRWIQKSSSRRRRLRLGGNVGIGLTFALIGCSQGRSGGRRGVFDGGSISHRRGGGDFVTATASESKNYYHFHKALNEAFEVFCNKAVAGSSCAELLAAFCDDLLKKGGGEKLSGDQGIEETLEKAIKTLLPYISDKDHFAEFYRKRLACRLLFDRSANKDHEKSIITKMKQQCGGQFTSKMEGMVTDWTLARETQNSFEEYLHCNPNINPGMDLAVTVLTTGSWPSYESFNLNLPSEMRKILHSLSCGKYKILVKEPNIKFISPNDTFEFNSMFTDRMIRIKIPLPPVDHERKEVMKDVDKDRRYAIDAAIVRIMKSRKVFGHQELVIECVEQLRHMFKPDIKTIKKRIEDLIIRELGERQGEPKSI
ncbi:hypothetical protein ACLB2K_049925 [Fragaria x ananassa]